MTLAPGMSGVWNLIAKETKRKENKSIYIKLENFCTMKEAISKNERIPY